jgi:hypothetical protein
MSRAAQPIRWGRAFGALFLSVPYLTVLGTLAMLVSENVAWHHGFPSHVDWPNVSEEAGAYPVYLLIVAPFVVAVVGMPTAALLAVALRRIGMRSIRLIVHAVVGSALGTLLFSTMPPYADLSALLPGLACGLSAVLGIVTVDKISTRRASAVRAIRAMDDTIAAQS